MRELAGLRVCFIAGTLGQGGAERQLYYMLGALVRSGAEPRVLCLTRGEYWEAPIRELGISVTWVGRSRSRLRRLAEIVSVLRRERVDVIQSQHFYTNIYATLAARALGVREVGALRSDALSEVRASEGVLGRISLHAPRTIAANSRRGMENALSLGASPRRLHFLPNVVDTAQFTACGRSPDDAVRILTVGRLVPQKRFDRFVRVIDRARRQSQVPVRGIVVGDGPLRAQLEAQARALGLGPDAFEMRGLASDVAPCYRGADALVLTSDWEGTPNVVLEAMASGLPVVATAVGGLCDLVRTGETGFLVEPDDEAALSEAVLALVLDEGMRRSYGDRARRLVEEHHALPRLTRELGTLYGAVLNGGRA